MTDEKVVVKKRKKKWYPSNKEQASKKEQKEPSKDIKDSLKELQAFINSKYHTQ
jgi:oligoribonuclease (3'-5' exoribonuclease)